jgi:hypothetical protein
VDFSRIEMCGSPVQACIHYFLEQTNILIQLQSSHTAVQIWSKYSPAICSSKFWSFIELQMFLEFVGPLEKISTEVGTDALYTGYVTQKKFMGHRWLMLTKLDHRTNVPTWCNILWKVDSYSADHRIAWFLYRAIGLYPEPAESSSTHRSLSP